MAEFVAKKREMFLVQMALDTKREEIRKLEEKAQMKEEALKKSEQMLEEDAIRFDTFLKENDKKAHEAIKRAEAESQLKNQKVAEIKKKNQEIALVISETAKHREALDDCLKYKAFLDGLTPPEHFEQAARAKRERQEARRQRRVAARRRQWEAQKAAIVQEAEAREAAEAEALAKQGKVRRKDQRANPRAGLQFPPRPRSEDEPPTSSDEDPPMYFQRPAQLLAVFQGLEEQNLFLIQNSQETEHALEELNKTYRATKRKMEAKTAALRRNVEELEAQVERERAKGRALDEKLGFSHGSARGQQERLLRRLHARVLEVYGQCGFDATSNPQTLTMLSDLESRLEDLLKSVAQMPPDYVRRAEKDKEKKRREKKRLEQQLLAEKQQEERNKKAIERSLQAPKKRTGRQVMFRSQVVRKAIVEDKTEDNEEDLDEIKFLS